MPRNVEIKVRIEPPASLAAVASRAASLADAPPQDLAQDDSFFHVPHGRLKLRVFRNGGRSGDSGDGGDGDNPSGELIAYSRDDTAGLRTSSYVRSAVTEAHTLREALARSCGLRGRVVKQRTLYRIGATRVHLDRVQGLGDFVELEVVLRDGEPAEHGEAVARHLLDALGLDGARSIAGAYIDLLEARSAATPPSAATKDTPT